MTIADLIIKMSLDGKGVTRGADQAIAQFRRIGRAAAAFAGGGLIAAAVTSFSRKTIEMAGTLSDLRDKTGLSLKTLQQFAYGAEQTGTTVDAVADAFTKMQQAMVGAMQGDEKKLNAFARMGLSVEDLRRTNPEQVFNKIAASLKNATINAQVTTDTITLMGRSATDFLPALRSGFADFAEQAEAAGVIIEDEVIQKLDALGDKWGTLGKQLMVTLAPPLAWLADKIHVINVGLSATLAALKSIGTDFKNDALGTIANFLFPTSGSFGGNPLTRAKEAAQKAGFATIRGYENAKSGPPTLNEAIEIEEEVKEKKKRERQARIEQISDVSNHTISTDAMQRMGLYIGPVSQLKQVADRQLSELKAVRSHMSKMLQIAEEER